MKTSRQRRVSAFACAIVAVASLFWSTPSPAEDWVAAYNAALEAVRRGDITPLQWKNISETLKRDHGVRINPVSGYAIGVGPAQPTATPQTAPAAGNGPGIAPAVPLCTSQTVKDKVLRAIYQDLGKLGVPTNNMKDVDDAVARLAPSQTAVTQQARQNVSRAGGVPLDHIAVCQPTNGHPLAVLVALNPRRTSQWGVMVYNYGIPSRAATQDVEFMN